MHSSYIIHVHGHGERESGPIYGSGVMLITLCPTHPHNMPTTIEGDGAIVDCITGVTVVRLHMELSLRREGVIESLAYLSLDELI